MRVLLLRLMLRNLHPLPVVSRQLVPGSSSCFVPVNSAPALLQDCPNWSALQGRNVTGPLPHLTGHLLRCSIV